MSEQLALIELAPEPAAPKLTDRQELVLDAVNRAGPVDGLHADEAGALLCAHRGKHKVEDRCRWCGANGKDVLNALKTKGLVRYRRARSSRVGFAGQPGAWFAVADATEDPAKDTALLPGMTDVIPY